MVVLRAGTNVFSLPIEGPSAIDHHGLVGAGQVISDGDVVEARETVSFLGVAVTVEGKPIIGAAYEPVVIAGLPPGSTACDIESLVEDEVATDSLTLAIVEWWNDAMSRYGMACVRFDAEGSYPVEARVGGQQMSVTLVY